jgi:hypothetical protein
MNGRYWGSDYSSHNYGKKIILIVSSAAVDRFVLWMSQVIVVTRLRLRGYQNKHDLLSVSKQGQIYGSRYCGQLFPVNLHNIYYTLVHNTAQFKKKIKWGYTKVSNQNDKRSKPHWQFGQCKTLFQNDQTRTLTVSIFSIKRQELMPQVQSER